MLFVAFALLCAAGIVGLALRRQAPARITALVATAAWLLTIAAAVVLATAGALAVAGHRLTADLGSLDVLGQAELRLDRLSGLFLLICFATAVPVLLACLSPVRRGARLPALVAVALTGVALILTADNLFVLLLGWETLTVAFYLLAGYDRALPGRPRAAVAAITFGRFSGACLLVGGLLLSARTHTFTLAGLGSGPHDAGRQVAYGLLVLGFGVKVGLVPLQVWLPPAYSAAPGPARAAMAGVAVNVGFYGMFRTLQILGPAPVWLATVVLVIAGTTALLGIAHAAVHSDLLGLIAWSSVENAGVITAGFGAALVGSAVSDERLVAAGLLASTAQIIAHSLGKSLLFTAASTVEADTGTTELDPLGGLARTQPWAAAGLVVGALTLAGLPLTAGFASEWFTLEALMQQFRISSLPMQLGSAAAGAMVALTVGVAGVTFVRLIALTAFGEPRLRRQPRPAPGALPHRAAVLALALACFAVAALAPLEVRVIAAGLRPIAGSATSGALASPWVLQPVFAEFSALSPTWLWIVIPTGAAAVAGLAALLSGNRLWRVRRVPAWSSASAVGDSGVGYTSFAYANPMRRVLANLLLTRGQLEASAPADGPLPPTREDDPTGEDVALTYRVDVVEVVEHYLYQPALNLLTVVVRVAKRLQSGRLDAYMTYMLIALVAVLAVVTAVS